MAVGWKYLLVDSRDMSLIQELRKSSGRTLTVDGNKSGSVDFGYLTGAPHAGDIWPWQTAVVAQRDDQWFWSGPVSGMPSADFSAGKMQVSAQGWFEKLHHILIQEKVSFVDKDAAVIVSGLLDLARAQDPTMPITIGTVESSQKRTLTCDIDQPIGGLIQQLVDVESGFDWDIDPRTRQLNIFARRGQDQTNCKWFYVPDDPNPNVSNLNNVIRSVDGMTVVNESRPRGKFASGFADDAESKNRYGVFQESPSLLDVVDTDILNAFANAEIVYKKDPRTTYQIFPKPYAPPPAKKVPRIFNDFNIFDTTYLTARKDFLELTDQAVRLFGATLAIQDGSGAEMISNLETTAG